MLVGTFLAFDKHLNVILSECEEYRIRRKGNYLNIYIFIGNVDVEIKRTVGMVVVRGDNIVSLSAEAPPH
jgi:small nuclear ribonucleoprotein B and B'